jgi:hypothetical protein
MFCLFCNCFHCSLASFSKGALDLLEAMLYAHNVKAVRFDGDVPTDERTKVLHDFKNDASYRVLLMTVQTGGTGLNIKEANHIFFVERYCKFVRSTSEVPPPNQCSSCLFHLFLTYQGIQW